METPTAPAKAANGTGDDRDPAVESEVSHGEHLLSVDAIR